MRQHSLCTDELRVEVGLDNALPEIERHLLYQFVAANAGVIDQNIDASMPRPIPFAPPVTIAVSPLRDSGIGVAGSFLLSVILNFQA